MTRELNVLRDREEPELLIDIRDFTTLLYVIFETQVLRMVRVVSAEQHKCAT